MADLFAKQALLADGWHENVRIALADGRIAGITRNGMAQADDERHDALLAAMPNLHSHAFQRAMAGLAEQRGPGADSFWSWRTLMYRFALGMTPDDVEAVAAQVYMEMLEGGFSRVGEFHYLHHDHDGRPYADPAEMAGRIVAASAEAGIGLTLLPVFYAHSGFGAAPPTEGQRRFINTLDGYAAIMARCAELVKQIPGANLGVAPHSLRAATLAQIRNVAPLAQGGPIHIHIAEQMREVEECLAATGARPVELLLREIAVDERWCLIHATHLTGAEIAAIAGSGAIAGLCPVTEANLGDGIFSGSEFRAAGGRFGIGSDCNIRMGVADELRQFEYSQRLGRQARNVIASAGASTGATLFAGAGIGGAAALGVSHGLAEGAPADMMSLNTKSVPYMAGDQLIDAFIFGGAVGVDCVWTQGQKRVSGGRHRQREAIERRFIATMTRLMAAA